MAVNITLKKWIDDVDPDSNTLVKELAKSINERLDEEDLTWMGDDFATAAFEAQYIKLHKLIKDKFIGFQFEEKDLKLKDKIDSEAAEEAW